MGQPRSVTQDDADHGLVSLTGGTVQHGQTILVLVQEAGSPGQQYLHHPSMTLLHCTPQWSGSILTLGVHILTNLNKKLSNLGEASNGSVVKSTVTQLISL